ncbi:CLUMA_CG013514, isoform A [Clunio marinus]|uniref:CLUMA_CG013514, isoform A n=1 Tax=Clunio marinus TaxID=568069 RepID=A0A1J1IP29_9DIPT|nr:CLUMA_CG013514, isoform A [Clunio marinus]
MNILLIYILRIWNELNAFALLKIGFNPASRRMLKKQIENQNGLGSFSILKVLSPLKNQTWKQAQYSYLASTLTLKEA